VLGFCKQREISVDPHSQLNLLPEMSNIYIHVVEKSTNAQERQCAYKITLRHFCESILAVEGSKYYIFWVPVCSLLYPACKAHAPYYIVIYLLTPQYVSTLSHKGHDFRKTLLNINCVLIFSTVFILNISHFRKNSARYRHKSKNIFM
jgi:hypothetical protein